MIDSKAFDIDFDNKRARLGPTIPPVELTLRRSMEGAVGNSPYANFDMPVMSIRSKYTRMIQLLVWYDDHRVMNNCRG